jgi:sugar phosphate isomerase/epimerase
MKNLHRRQFLGSAALLTGSFVFANPFSSHASRIIGNRQKILISGHIWVYASKFPQPWDCTPVIEQAFVDFQFAGLNGMELMEVNLRHADAVSHLGALAEKYGVPVTGASYGAAMWDRNKHQEIAQDAEMVIGKLHLLNAKTFGVSVGDAGHVKTEDELDAQADLLKKLMKLCEQNGLVLNLHNHVYEVTNNLHDLKGTLARIPDIKLGPDLNWLVRAGVDPVWFIQTYGRQIAYMHIRDQGSDQKWTETVGSGITNFNAIAEVLRQQSFDGRAAIELAFDQPPQHPLKEDWKNSLQFVRKTFEWE